MTSENVPFPSIQDIEKLILGCESREWLIYSEAFFAAANNDAGQNWTLLGEVFRFRLIAKDTVNPFHPMTSSGDRRSMIPSDLTESQLVDLERTLVAVGDPVYCARIADTIWVRRRDPKVARMAAEAYFSSARASEHPEHWTVSFERYERAIRLAWQLEPNGEMPKRYLSHLESRLKFYDGTDPLYFSFKIMSLLVEFECGDFIECASISEKAASRARSDGDFRRARSYYDVQAKLLKLAKEVGSAEAALVASAECFAEEAEYREADGSFIAAHHFWQKAIGAFRNRPTLRARIPDLQRRLANAGKESLSEMQIFTQEIEIRDEVDSTEKLFAGLSLSDAFCQLAVCCDLADPDGLRRDVIQEMKLYPLSALFGGDVLDSEGRKVAKKPAVTMDGDPKSEPGIVHQIHQKASFYRSVCTVGRILPATRSIAMRGEVLDDDLLSLISDSPFVPEGRLPVFAKALTLGFSGDYSTALHLLIPQIENSLRHILQCEGVVPRNFEKDGIEEVWGLDRILSHEVTQSVLGKSMVFALDSLLISRNGANLRNVLAHGLVSTDELNSEIGVYAWWLAYRLIVLRTSVFRAYIDRVSKRRPSAI